MVAMGPVEIGGPVAVLGPINKCASLAVDEMEDADGKGLSMGPVEIGGPEVVTGLMERVGSLVGREDVGGLGVAICPIDTRDSLAVRVVDDTDGSVAIEGLAETADDTGGSEGGNPVLLTHFKSTELLSSLGSW